MAWLSIAIVVDSYYEIHYNTFTYTYNVHPRKTASGLIILEDDLVTDPSMSRWRILYRGSSSKGQVSSV